MMTRILLVTVFVAFVIKDLNAVNWPCESDTDCSADGTTCSPTTNQCSCSNVGSVLSQDFSKCISASLFGDKCEESAQCNLMPSGAQCNSGVCACVGGYTYIRGQCRPLIGLNQQPCSTDNDCNFGYDRESVICQNQTCMCANGYYQRTANICRRNATAINDACVVDADCNALGPDVKCISLACKQSDVQKLVNNSQTHNELTHADYSSTVNGGIGLIAETESDNAQKSREIAIQTSIDALELRPLNKTVRHVATATSLTSDSSKKSSYLRHQAVVDARDDEDKTFSSLSNTDEDLEETKYGSSCTDNGKACSSLPHSICSNNVCLCRLGYYAKNNKCFAELGEIAESSNECEFQYDAISKKCLCQKNYFFEPNLRTCRKPIQFNLSCTSNSQCSPFGAALCGTDIPRRCQCTTFAKYDPLQQLCVFNQGLGGPCDSDEGCLIANSGCINKQCVCRKPFIGKEDSCVPGINANCTVDEDCKVDNSVCSGEQEQTCQCRKGFVHFKDECYKEAEKLNDDCLDSEQCQPLLATCVDNKCACTAEQHFKYGQCEQKRSIGESCSKAGQCYAEKDEETIECRNSVCQCKIGYQPDAEKKTCIRALPNKKNSSGRPSALKIITFILIGSAFLITSAAIRQAYF